MCSFTVFRGLGSGVWGLGSENPSVSGVTTICLMQCNTSPSHRVDQVVDCGLWNVGPLLFNGCAKLLDIGILDITLSMSSMTRNKVFREKKCVFVHAVKFIRQH